MPRNRLMLFLPFLLALHGHAAAAPACAGTLDELKDLMGGQALPLVWEETTMDDGKPLVMSIVEGNGSLLLGFTKTGEGLWAESSGVICQSGTDLAAQFSARQIRLGPAAGWFLRSALKNGGKFTLSRLGADQLRIATRGWSGEFSAVVR